MKSYTSNIEQRSGKLCKTSIPKDATENSI